MRINLDSISLEEVSIKELKALLEAEVNEMHLAYSHFNEVKADFLLQFRKIDVAQLKVDDGTTFDATTMQKKQELLAKIRKVRAHTERIERATAALSGDFELFFDKFSDITVTAKEIAILKNLGATEEEIDEFLRNYASHEDYNEIRMNYNEYKIEKMVNLGLVSSVFAEDDEISFDFQPGLV